MQIKNAQRHKYINTQDTQTSTVFWWILYQSSFFFFLFLMILSLFFFVFWFKTETKKKLWRLNSFTETSFYIFFSHKTNKTENQTLEFLWGPASPHWWNKIREKNWTKRKLLTRLERSSKLILKNGDKLSSFFFCVMSDFKVDWRGNFCRWRKRPVENTFRTGVTSGIMGKESDRGEGEE